jgi:hypothetical protein
LHPIPQPTPEQIKEWQQAAERWRLEHCYTLLDPWYRLFHRFNPRWLVDPPFDAGDPSREEHVWEIVVAGAVPGDTIGAFGPGGEQLGAVQVDAAGVMRLNVVTTPELPGGGLSTEDASGPPTVTAERSAGEFSLQRVRSGAAVDTGHRVGIQMMMKQILLIEQAQLLAGRSPEALVLTTRQGHRALLVTHNGAVSTYDLTNAASPRLVDQQLMGLVGSRRTGRNTLLGWDEGGVLLLSSVGTSRLMDLEGVMDVRTFGPGHLVARDNDIFVLDASWHILEVLDGAEPHPAVEELALTAAADGPFGATAHSRFGIVARIATDRVSIGVIAATRLV